MQNGTITYYLPYNILSSSNLVENVCIVEYKFIPGRIQWGAQGGRAPSPLNFQSGNTWMYTPSYLKGWCL